MVWEGIDDEALPKYESGFVHFAAMGNHMNRNTALRQFGGIQDTPVANPQLVKICKSTGQYLGVNLIVVFSKPLDLFYYSFCNGAIELREIFKRLRRKLNVIIQASFSLSFTS